MKFNLRFDNIDNMQKVCSAANLLRNLESIHSLQVALYYQISRWFPNKKSLNSHSNCVFKLIQILAASKIISLLTGFINNFSEKGIVSPYPNPFLNTYDEWCSISPHSSAILYTRLLCSQVSLLILPCDKATFGRKEAVPQREQIRQAGIKLPIADYVQT